VAITAFVCALCEVDITEALRPMAEAELAFRTGEAGVPRGHFAALSEPWSYPEFVTGRSAAHVHCGDEGVIAFAAGDFLVHPDDARHRVMARATYGCCGPQPRGELNATCANDHPVGTLHGDECWSSLVFRLRGDRVEAIRLE
jgi:hypothetical protein